jgi:hypothetical protein
VAVGAQTKRSFEDKCVPKLELGNEEVALKHAATLL